MKVCTKCNTSKELDMFGNDKQKIDGKCSHCKECRAKHRQENKDKIKEYRKKYNKDNKASIAKKCKEYQIQNKEAIATTKKLYSASQGGRFNRHKSIDKRMKRIKETMDGSITRQALDDLMEKQANCCGICGCDLTVLNKRNVHMDHIIPLVQGGTHTIDNIQWTCSNCNLRKGGSTVSPTGEK